MTNFRLFHVDDCMYVAAATADEARKHVQEECGEDCGELVHEVTPFLPVETADVDDGEKPTPRSKATAARVVARHLHAGGKLPFTVGFDLGM